MSELIQFFLEKFNFDKELAKLPQVEALEEYDWKSIEKKLPNVSGIEWRGDKDKLFLIFNWKPIMNVSIFAESYSYRIPYKGAKDKDIDYFCPEWSGMLGYSLKLNVDSMIVVEVTKKYIHIQAFLPKADIMPYSVMYNTNGENLKEKFKISYIDQLHANSEPIGLTYHPDDDEGVMYFDNLEDILYAIGMGGLYEYGSPFCSGDLSNDIPLVFFPNIFFKKIYDALTN